MAYTTVEQVKSLFRGIKIEATGTALTIPEVEEMIAEVDVEINGKLYDHYVTPISEIDSPQSFLLVGKISRMKVAHLIKTVLESTAELSDKNNEEQTNLEMKADKLLNDIIPTWDDKCCVWVDPVIQLPDAERKPTSPKSGAIFNSNKRMATIKRGGGNW